MITPMLTWAAVAAYLAIRAVALSERLGVRDDIGVFLVCAKIVFWPLVLFHKLTVILIGQGAEDKGVK